MKTKKYTCGGCKAVVTDTQNFCGNCGALFDANMKPYKGVKAGDKAILGNAEQAVVVRRISVSEAKKYLDEKTLTKVKSTNLLLVQLGKNDYEVVIHTIKKTPGEFMGVQEAIVLKQ